ncbi:hypothetical protein ACLMJK_000524 [Lecanora helva]
MAGIQSLPNDSEHLQEQDVHMNGADDLSHDELNEDNGPAVGARDQESPLFVSQGSLAAHSEDEEFAEALNPDAIERNGIAVIVPPVVNASEYVRQEEPSDVVEILEEYDDGGHIEYLVRFDDESEEVLSLDQLRQLANGPSLLNNSDSPDSEDPDSVELTPRLPSRSTRRSRNFRKTHISRLTLSSDDELAVAKPRPRRGRPRRSKIFTRSSLQRISDSDSDEMGWNAAGQRRSSIERKPVDYTDDGLTDDQRDALEGLPRKQKLILHGPHPENYTPDGQRRSGRIVQARSMRELGEDEIPERTGTRISVTRYFGPKETFQQLPEDDLFLRLHYQACLVCGEEGNSETRGILVYCQGCTTSIHQKCLGPRNGREHLVTKIGNEDFVLQCKKCIGGMNVKDSLASDPGLCFSCHDVGESTSPFREEKTPKQEQQEREQNNGEDPITDVPTNLIQNPSTLLFRCLRCSRGCHFHHLPAKDKRFAPEEVYQEDLAWLRFQEYGWTWFCKDCDESPEVDTLVAWRPQIIDLYQPGQTTEMVGIDGQDFLVKWKKLPYTKARWMPGNWVAGVVSAATRKAFARKNNTNNLPKMTTEEAIPEDFMRVDIVFDVRYTSVVNEPSEQVAKARIKEVQEVLVKFKGLGYEDVLWIEPPTQEDTERWIDYQTAYDEWVMGLFVSPPSKRELQHHLSSLRTQDFKSTVALQAQPKTMASGELMQYQLDGLNWIYYQWFQCQNAILADEMGLGKTIQVVAFFATLKQIHKCWPFLVVVPNATCPNWRREIKKWAPSLRVVTYYGSSEARSLAKKYELFSKGDKQLKCHVVVTSYEAAQDGEFRKTFRAVNWVGLVVDEGQRLKSDKNLLYSSLNTLKIPFKLLLTGTPLQNNARELFNLLQFLDPQVNAEAMEREYATLTGENVTRLHNQLKQILLRRTKAEVLKFLPPMGQVIIPVTMSVLQKKLCKSILKQSPHLIRSIIGAKKALSTKDRANLNNILMQLRKCLAHPFVFNREIEEKSGNPKKSHRNLVDASPKLQLLELMLPKLQDRGHRVLIFSQFLNMLDMVEDFLDGLGLSYQRLDGSMGALDKQKRIDEFNAPKSSLFAFLLSTRAGGVGINLATADTVIILDPDFNPHQDIQALSRAHRIGQDKKVLCFQLTTRSSAEEKIMQIGKKKMALDHVVIEQMGVEDDAGLNLESILKHGADALFKNDESQDIKYDSASVDLLLDRSGMEDTQTDRNKSAESQFSFARVWENDKAVLEEGMQDTQDPEPDISVWDNILKEREREAQAAAATQVEDLGRGRRKRRSVDYAKQINHGADTTPKFKGRKRRAEELESDTDFLADESEAPDSDEQTKDQNFVLNADEVVALGNSRQLESQSSSAINKGRSFKRAVIPTPAFKGQTSPTSLPRAPPQLPAVSTNSFKYPQPIHKGTETLKPILKSNRSISPYDGADDEPFIHCALCRTVHPEGYCPLKLGGVEHCGLCGLAHFGYARTCPHLQSITQLRAMLEALKSSPEPPELKALAKKKITGIIGSINQQRRKVAEKKAAATQNGQEPNSQNLNLPQSYTVSNDNGQSHVYPTPQPVARQHSYTPRAEANAD